MTSSGASDANAELHATLLEISRHGTARRLIRALSSQTVRYQYRTILILGRSAASLEEHKAIVDAVRGRPDEAEAAMRNHLFNVAEAVQRGCSLGGVDMRAAVCSEEPRDGPHSVDDGAIGARWHVPSVPKLLTTLVLIWLIEQSRTGWPSESRSRSG